MLRASKNYYQLGCKSLQYMLIDKFGSQQEINWKGVSGKQSLPDFWIINSNVELQLFLSENASLSTDVGDIDLAFLAKRI